MRSKSLIIILALTGGILSFCLWPVVAGISNQYVCGPTADCPSELHHTYRLDYLLHSHRYNTNWAAEGWKSKDEYCTYASCMKEAVAVPISIASGLAAGAAFSLLILLIVRTNDARKINTKSPKLRIR
jgi:hypothetical protein